METSIERQNKTGLSGSAIKCIGAAMMVFDHIHQMFQVNGAPLWFTWIGRPVLPIFLFLCVEGWTHTRSKKRYLLQLLIGFELMNILSMIIETAMPNENAALMNNVFQTLFFTALYMLFIEMFAGGIQNKRAGKILLALFLMIAPIVLGVFSLVLMGRDLPRWLIMVLFKFIPNLFATEGGWTAIIMGLLFYLLRKKRALQIAGFAAFCAVSLVMFLREGSGLFSGSAQWLMVLAVIPIALYNGERGKGNKYFFYIFYPAHIYILYIIAWFFRP